LTSARRHAESGQARRAAEATICFGSLQIISPAMSISVEVVYALPQRQERLLLNLPPDSTALDAVLASGLLRHLPQQEIGRIGVWGRPVAPETRLRDRDRVEIYRPLVADPMEIRRNRAAKKRQ
jgi:uncharacterized protein